ncbi:MAG: hypothetical protein HKO66_17155 [Saprospiraceae bacterium]|nr:hypothetical protein [Saprospiraceae bacterium]
MKKFTQNIILIFLGFSSVLSGQDTTSIATENIQVIRNYEAIIQQAKQKKIGVEKADEQLVPINYSYNLKSEVDLDFDRPDPIIRPKTYKVPDPTNNDLKDGRIYGGYGNLSTLKLGGAYHYYIEDWVEAGFKVDHHSAADQSVDFQKYANTDGHLYLGYFLSNKTKATLEFRGGNSKHYSPAMANVQDSIIQHNFNNQGATLGLSVNAFDHLGLSLRTRFSYDRIKQTNDDVQENRLRGELNLLKKINDNISLEVPAEISRYSFSTPLDTSFDKTYNDVQLSPFIRFKDNRFNVYGGLEIIATRDKTFYFPVFKFEMEDVFEEVDVSLFTESKYKRNNVFELSGIIPYYLSVVSPLNPNYDRSFNLNLKRNSGHAVFNLQFGYHNYVGDLNVVHAAIFTRPSIRTIDRKAFIISPSIGYNTKQTELNLKLDYSVFITVPQEEVFYRPSLYIDFSAAQYLFDRKLKLHQNIAFANSRFIQNDIDATTTLNSYVDLSVGFDFRVNNTISLFAQGTNLLANNYELWLGHPVFERQIWAGLKFDL